MLSVTVLLVWLLKHFNTHMRPDLSDSDSWPSGHMALATFIWPCLLSFVKDFSGFKKINWQFKLIMTGVFFLAIARLYVLEHWLVDVLSGFCLGMCSYFFFQILAVRSPQVILSYRYGVLFLLISGIISLGLVVTHNVDMRSDFYDNQFQTPGSMVIDADQLAAQNAIADFDMSELMVRDDFFGHKHNYLNVQIPGELGVIKSALLDRGWLEKDKVSFFQRFVGLISLGKERVLPLFSENYKYRPPLFIATKQQGDRVYILRLFASDYLVADGKSSSRLYVGQVNVLRHSPRYIHPEDRFMPGFDILSNLFRFNKVFKLDESGLPYIKGILWDRTGIVVEDYI